jgi:ABC-type lipoprotein export system ATPase subunit/ABC-type antimicrobial peptide transport system permease subunit
MNENTIIEINNLSCSYSKKAEDKVLYIQNLKLQKGKIIFLLGASGSGKSTLLETLGLMNNTIAGGKVELVDGLVRHDFSSLWKPDNEKEITRIRKDFLSFIFQNTNLMESFTAYENICLSQMIKSNADQSKAISEAVTLMQQVGLPPNEVDFEKLSVNLSGGQKQRVSFVRALNTNFKILFCDEPTGNLDERNAHELINIIKQNLTQEKTAILVSHDINLALKFADQIIVISKNADKKCGEILSENVFEKEQWQPLEPNKLADFRTKLLSFFASDAKNNDTDKDLPSSVKPTTYRQLFLEKEGKVLFGKSKVNLFILITILSLTLLSIGFANGTLKYLNDKLNDPFVNWLTVGIPWAKSNASIVTDITDNLNSDEVKEHYLIDVATSYKEVMLPFFKTENKDNEYIKGRLIASDDPIISVLLSLENKISGTDNFSDERDLGIVVTADMLKRLHYPIDTKVIYMDNMDEDITQGKKQRFKVPIPVKAVIKEIPGRNKFLITTFFYKSYINHEFCVFDFKEQTKRILFYVENQKLAKEFATKIEKMQPAFNLMDQGSSDSEMDSSNESDNNAGEDASNENFKKKSVTYDSTETTEKLRTLEITVNSENQCELMNTPGYEVSVEFSAKPFNYTTTENVFAKIAQSEFYKKNNDKIIRIFDFGIAPDPDVEIHNDYLCINFKKNGLDSVEAFSKYVVQNLNEENVKEETNMIVVDSGAVKEKKNFNYISKMTLLISLLLIIFSIISISLFISNLLKTHLNKVKMNLGTFKAFGLSNQESINIYLQIMLRFVFTGLIFSLVISFVLGNVIDKIFSAWLSIEDQSAYFRLFDLNTYILITIIVVVSAIVSYLNIKKILSKTPGDLIYNR